MDMTIIGILCFLLLAGNLAGLVQAVLCNVRSKISGIGQVQWISVFVVTLLLATILLRPHEDTFAGLDNSGYRLMARAFQADRQMHGVDKVLLDVPRDIRNSFMLLPTMDERNTRDRSFLVKSLDKCETEPFFYPFLPLCAVGFDALVPGDALDYLVPVIGLLFAFILLLVGAAYGGWLGVVLAAALLAGSPLPAWLLRGFYVESVASVLLSLALINWLTCQEGKRVSRFAYLALGLAVSLHPAMVVISLPLLMVFVLNLKEQLRDVLAGVVCFGAGFAVMVGMIMYACSPYGDLSFSSLKYNFVISASHRVTLACAGLIVIVTAVAVMAKPAWAGWYGRLSETRRHFVTFLPAALSILPVLYAATAWSQKAFVRQGIYEIGSGVRLALGVMLIILGLHVFISRPNVRARMALMVVLLALPVFAYLKGAEQMGLWSQRRLLPLYLLLVVVLLPSSAELLDSFVRKIPRPMNLPTACAVACLLLVSGTANAFRWPAPYTVRCDRGAWNWVEKIRARIGNRLVFFDYYPFSVPFAVNEKTRALGLCERAERGMADISGWLADKAGKEEVLVATAYENPGVEEGLILSESFSESIQLNKAVSSGPLPAEKRVQDVTIRFLLALPALSGDHLPVLNKIFDDGPLAVRGLWGKGCPIAHKGKLLPARWSREGSGVVGPVPLPGKAVKIIVDAAASRDDGIDGQVLKIVPPWGGEILALSVSNDYCSVSGLLLRPPDNKKDVNLKTGIYRISADKPYDPARAGIKGYESDLGARIHKIRIEP